MTTYQVDATRSGKWWAIEIRGHPGIRSQSRRLDQAAEQAADALSLALDIDVTPDEVVLSEVRVGDEDLDAQVQRALQLMYQASAATAAATEAVDAAVIAAGEVMLPDRDIGTLLGVSHQRVAQRRKRVRQAVRS